MTVEPENRLWQAVVLQAFFDATRPLTKRWQRGEGTTERTGHTEEIERGHARRWLLLDDDSFPLVCVAANLDPFYVRAKAYWLKDSGWPEPPRGPEIRAIRCAEEYPDDGDPGFSHHPTKDCCELGDFVQDSRASYQRYDDLTGSTACAS